MDTNWLFCEAKLLAAVSATDSLLGYAALSVMTMIYRLSLSDRQDIAIPRCKAVATASGLSEFKFALGSWHVGSQPVDKSLNSTHTCCLNNIHLMYGTLPSAITKATIPIPTEGEILSSTSARDDISLFSPSI